MTRVRRMVETAGLFLLGTVFYTGLCGICWVLESNGEPNP